MPGVPSGRGCEACRKQKKKCDQARPSCSRCSRVGIDCVGSGKKRYKFVEEPVTSKSTSLIQANYQAHTVKVNQITWVPSNEIAMVTGAFCSALSVTDVRYDLSVYGQFFKDIPKRLGKNVALDASAGAITAALTSVHSKRESVEAIEKYVHALETLRASLGDPTEARSPDTLCAVYLMMVCQGWIGHYDDCTGHGEVIAYLLSCVASQGWQGNFESELMITLCVPVIFESIGNPRIRLQPWLGKMTEAHDKTVTIEGLKLGNLAKLPDFIRHPELHLFEIESSHQSIQKDLPKIRETLSKLCEQGSIMRTLHARYQTLHSILLGTSIIMSTILCSFGSGSLSVAAESGTFIDELIKLAEDASQYRPLGSSSIPLFLTVAWVASGEASKRTRIEEILAEYQTDFAISRWVEIAVWLDNELKRGCRKRLVAPEVDVRMQMPKDAAGQCCMM